MQERVQDGDLSVKKVLTAKNCADVGSKPVCASVPQQAAHICRIGILLTMDPTLHYEMMGDLFEQACAGMSKTERNKTIVGLGYVGRDGSRTA